MSQNVPVHLNKEPSCEETAKPNEEAQVKDEKGVCHLNCLKITFI